MIIKTTLFKSPFLLGGTHALLIRETNQTESNQMLVFGEKGKPEYLEKIL